MREVHERVHVGRELDCFRREREGWSVVHACKDPCHRRAVGYSGRSLASNHANYLILELGSHLYMNLVDPDRPLFMPQSFASFREFARTHYASGRNLLIHCNQGGSRAPSLALLFLAKDMDVLTNDSYAAARREYEDLDPLYRPGAGIEAYLTRHWTEL